MKLTKCLQRNNYGWLLNQMWKYGRSRIRPTHLNVPLYLKKQGTPIVSAAEILDMDKAVFAKWEPPVKDDPRVKEAWKPQDHQDYHEQAIYQFTPNSQLEEGERQACILSKSQAFHHLPPSITSLIGVVSLQDQDLLMKRIIMSANKLEATKVSLPRRKNPDLPIWKFKAEFGIPDIKIAKLTLEGVVRLCNCLLGLYPDLALSRTLANNVLHSSHFAYNNETDVSIKGSLDMLLYSSKLLPSFVSDDIIDQSISHTLPIIHPLFPTIDLTHQHIWKYENNLGYKGSFAFPYPHTTFLCHDDTWSTSQRNARALMFCFGNAVGIAKNLYGKDIVDLPKPVSAQCIMTNGINFTFTCFQLNSLNYSSPVKNLVWFDSENQVVNKIIPKRSMLRHTKYEDYNPEVISKVLAFYANGVDLAKEDFCSENSNDMNLKKLEN